MRICLLRVAEKRVRDPDFSYHVAVETQNLHGAVELQPPVIPRLGEEDVNRILLRNRKGQAFQTKPMTECIPPYPNYNTRSIPLCFAIFGHFINA